MFQGSNGTDLLVELMQFLEEESEKVSSKIEKVGQSCMRLSTEYSHPALIARKKDKNQTAKEMN